MWCPMPGMHYVCMCTHSEKCSQVDVCVGKNFCSVKESSVIFKLGHIIALCKIQTIKKIEWKIRFSAGLDFCVRYVGDSLVYTADAFQTFHLRDRGCLKSRL